MYNNYKKVSLIKSNQKLITIPLKYGTEDIDIVLEQDVNKYVPSKYDTSNLKVVTSPEQESFQAPIKKGTLLAKTQVLLEDEIVYETEHFASKDYKISLVYKIFFITLDILKFIIVLIIVLVLLVFGIRTYNIQKARNRRAMRAKTKIK